MGAEGDLKSRLRRLPKVDDVLREAAARTLLGRAPRWAVLAAIRDEIDGLRQRLLATRGDSDSDSTSSVTIDDAALGRRVDALTRSSLVRVLNATGVVLHTNLGRAPLAEEAVTRVVEVARGYSTLEYRLDERARGSRHEHVERLITRLTGAEAALVVNNGAAAVMLTLSALCAGREVVVSRGELVEIGGSFRIPDVMRGSGARLAEVGTTNRTHPRDYERAISEHTAALMKVHQSNFKVIGFTAEATVEDLARIGKARGVRVIVDLGSGSLMPTAGLGLPAEPTATEVVAAGADVVTFSGDKLLGGPQAGIILCRAADREAIRTHPLMRAFRPDKLCLAALEATLELYRDGREVECVPTLRMLAATQHDLRARAERLLDEGARAAPWLGLELAAMAGAVGGGALPGSQPPSWGVAARHPTWTVDALDRRLHAARPPLIGRIQDGRLLLDARTLADDDIAAAARALGETATDAAEAGAP